MFEVMTCGRKPWSIFDELASLQEDVSRVPRRRAAYPLMNVWSSEDGMVIDAELPGVDPKGVDISVIGDELTLRGKVNGEEAGKDDTCLRRERPAGEFVRTLQIPFRADAGAVKAHYKNGVLRITIPRSEAEKPRKIEIEA